jgi:hypothetical protein
MSARTKEIVAACVAARRTTTLCGQFVTSLCLISISCAEALDLTPKESFRNQEGFKIPIVCFSGGARAVSWQPPPGWQLSGGGRTLSVFPPNVPLAYAKLEITAQRVATGSESPAQLARLHLPSDATEVSVAGERDNPFTLNGFASKEWIFSYVSQAQRFFTGIAMVDLDEKERLALVVSARATDFKSVHDEAIASMFTWKYAE